MVVVVIVRILSALVVPTLLGPTSESHTMFAVPHCHPDLNAQAVRAGQVALRDRKLLTYVEYCRGRGSRMRQRAKSDNELVVQCSRLSEKDSNRKISCGYRAAARRVRTRAGVMTTWPGTRRLPGSFHYFRFAAMPAAKLRAGMCAFSPNRLPQLIISSISYKRAAENSMVTQGQ
jgi:hypothetical protein